MVSQHTANVPSVHARLGSIPRLSAKLVSKKVRVSGGYGWPRLPVEQSAPSERPGSNPGTPTIEGPVVQRAEATGSKSVKSGFESQRGHHWPSLAHLRAPAAIADAPNRLPTKFATIRFQSGSSICANDRHRSWSLCDRVTR